MNDVEVKCTQEDSIMNNIKINTTISLLPKVTCGKHDAHYIISPFVVRMYCVSEKWNDQW